MVRPCAIAVVLGAALLVFAHAHPLKFKHAVRVGETATPLDGTIYDFFFKDGTAGVQALDSDNSDYDLLKLLFTYAGEQNLLKSTGIANDGITLFAPTDEALTQTARDIREIFSLSDTAIPVQEGDAWKVYEAWFDTLDDPKATLSRILKYHLITEREYNLADLLQEPTLTTSSGEVILRSGIKFIDGDPRFEDAQLLMDCHYTMDNGAIHPIDRMLFPDPKGKGSTPDHVPPVDDVTPSAAPPVPSEQSVPAGGDNSAQVSAPGPATATSQSPGAASSSDQSGDASCFPASAIVHLSDGSTLGISQLSAGHVIISSITDRVSSTVYLFSHREHNTIHDFVRITSAHGHEITLTPGHYLYANGRKTAANRVKLGDKLQTVDGESLVTSIQMVRERGLFAPHTLHGDIVVNGILASSYTTAVSPRIAHMLLWPLRMLVRAGIAVEPLGGLLYNGSPRLAAIIPSGYDVY